MQNNKNASSKNCSKRLKNSCRLKRCLLCSVKSLKIPPGNLKGFFICISRFIELVFVFTAYDETLCKYTVPAFKGGVELV